MFILYHKPVNLSTCQNGDVEDPLVLRLSVHLGGLKEGSNIIFLCFNVLTFKEKFIGLNNNFS